MRLLRIVVEVVVVVSEFSGVEDYLLLACAIIERIEFERGSAMPTYVSLG